MKTKKIKAMTILVSIALGSCMGWSCSTDMRDALWGGILDYVTGTTTDSLDCALNLGCE